MSHPLGTFTAHHPLNWSPAQIDTLTEFQFSHPIFLSYVRKQQQQQQQQQQLHGGASGGGATKKAIDFTDLTIPPALLHDLGFTLLTATTTNFVGERILPIVETGVRDVLGRMWRETSGMIRASSQGPRTAQQMAKKEEAADDHFTLSSARDYTMGNYYGGKTDGSGGGGGADKLWFAGYGHGKVGESSRQLRSSGSAKEEAYTLWQAQAKGNGMEEKGEKKGKMEEKGEKKGKVEEEEEVEEEEALLAENLAENAALDQQLSEMVARPDGVVLGDWVKIMENDDDDDDDDYNDDDDGAVDGADRSTAAASADAGAVSIALAVAVAGPGPGLVGARCNSKHVPEVRWLGRQVREPIAKAGARCTRWAGARPSSWGKCTMRADQDLEGKTGRRATFEPTLRTALRVEGGAGAGAGTEAGAGTKARAGARARARASTNAKAEAGARCKP
ncbi:hypothetical protein MBM_09293 [Drepanopeziza brunnea f. sp. 'multigermtubi' MB_m1]|uniref:Uncharacterized protein n=1 Tax=Marssonina brunnea f. sp. multigermtubi (strain MB_m1) TaxID=1072389 RepID=K1WJY0_MARBU|nr:uncharacterized protein MBM_09293 [Drepanopeziza brunnea f. sp. 'multigermtubi' MB_m1]EKD12537.1 hypothetical protein MBM_09293 [Drepanopeziza brunnea f. sp. 'multigermtubi' MB_m1]